MKFLKKNNKIAAILSAFLSAFLFAVCVPFAKLLSSHISQFFLGGFLYLGAGIGLLISFAFKKGDNSLSFDKKDFPYIFMMIFLDISAILLLMSGISRTSGANASLLGNFELVATSVAAFLFFKEKISKKLFVAIILITLASIILTFEGRGSFSFNFGSFLVLLSCVCWGFENNCTRKLSLKDTRKITIIKGCFSGIGSIIIAFLALEQIQYSKWIFLALLLGFVSYGVSVCLYIYAQRFLGAAKTGAIYSGAPFFGVLLSLIILSERLQLQFFIALLIMIIAAILVICDSKNS